jgi:rubrerythrin
MDIFKFAMEKEKHSEQFYRDLAKQTSCVGLRNVLTMLADEEVKHYEVVRRMQTETPHGVSDTPVLKHARQFLQKMRGSTKKFDFHVTEADLYRKACDIEEQSRRFYLQQAEQTEDPAQKEIFRRLAEEENRHWVVVDNLRGFVAQPESFLENAEMFHYDDYVDGVL